MSPPLGSAFLGPPIAHRALHGAGRPENSLAAIRAAAAAGFGIEIDLRPSRDGRAMVFHDATLDRLTDARGAVAGRDAADLGRIPLAGTDERIPTLADALDAVSGRVPLLVELKSRDGTLGPDIDGLAEAAARDLAGYGGPVAVMSFNPHVVARLGAIAPDLPRGLVTSAFTAESWPEIPARRRAELARIDSLDATGAGFISHDARDLDSPRVAEIRAAGLPVLCWTIRSAAAARRAAGFADNFTFEGFLPAAVGTTWP